MTTYTVHLTFSAPGQTGRLDRKASLPGRAGSLRIEGGGGTLAAVVQLKNQESLAVAAAHAADAVQREFRLSGTGPITLLTWTATRPRVLAGLRSGVERASGTGDDWPFGHRGDEDGGLAGVREPRRPKPAPPSMGMVLPLPGDPAP